METLFSIFFFLFVVPTILSTIFVVLMSFVGLILAFYGTFIRNGGSNE